MNFFLYAPFGLVFAKTVLSDPSRASEHCMLSDLCGRLVSRPIGQRSSVITVTGSAQGGAEIATLLLRDRDLVGGVRPHLCADRRLGRDHFKPSCAYPCVRRRRSNWVARFCCRMSGLEPTPIAASSRVAAFGGVRPVCFLSNFGGFGIQPIAGNQFPRLGGGASRFS